MARFSTCSSALVDNHLRHIFGKLAISRRVELARLIAIADVESEA
jgi:DNA-binding CsgD family transcriptional regulator